MVPAHSQHMASANRYHYGVFVIAFIHGYAVCPLTAGGHGPGHLVQYVYVHCLQLAHMKLFPNSWPHWEKISGEQWEHLNAAMQGQTGGGSSRKVP